MHRQSKLDELGMVWDITLVRKPKKQKQIKIKKEKTPKENKYIQIFESMLEEYKKYVTENNNVLVPLSYVMEDGKKSGSWIGQQRGIRKGSRKHSIVMDEERITRLDNIGMDWNPSPFVHKKRNKPNM